MDNNQLVKRLSDMSYNDLMMKIRGIRKARVDVNTIRQQEKEKKEAKPKRAQKKAVDKLLDGMSAEERLALLKILEASK